MSDQERQDVNTFKHELVKQARWWQWKAEQTEKQLKATNSELERVRDENAALRERLEKSIELPILLGQKIYIVKEKFSKEFNWQYEIIETKALYCVAAISGSKIYTGEDYADYENFYVKTNDYNKTWFTDFTLAKQYLASLQQGK